MRRAKKAPDKRPHATDTLKYCTFAKNDLMKKISLFLCILPLFIQAQIPVTNGLYSLHLPDGDNRIQKAFLKDDSSNIWLGFSSMGLACFKEGSWTTYNTSNSRLNSNQVNCLLQAASGEMLIGTNRGLCVFDVGLNQWKLYHKGNSALPSLNITCLVKQGDAVWIGTDQGLAKLENDTITVPLALTASVSDINITGDTLYAGLANGLLELKATGWNIHKYQNKDIRVGKMAIDKDKRVWFSSDLGIFYLASEEIHPITDRIDCFQDLNNDDIKGNRGLTSDPDGNVYFSSSKNNSLLGTSDIFIYRINENRLENYRFYKEYSFAVTGLHSDKAGNIWILYSDKNISDSIYMLKPSEYVDKLKSDPKPGESFQRLDINKMNAGILNGGDMFLDRGSKPALEVPKGSCKNMAISGSLWVGGLDPGNNLHLAAQTYRQMGFDYYPGPLDTLTGKGELSPSGKNPYDRIWKISRMEIERFNEAFAAGKVSNGTYIPSADFTEWPAHGSGSYSRSLAPFVDVNKDGQYNPADGDYPDIKGDQMLFWIFNDNTEAHSESKGQPLGIEIHASAYAFNCNDIADGSEDEALNYSTFYHYKIINRSSNTYSKMYYGCWIDPEIGNYTDDFVGCNPEGNYMFSYNGDNHDEGLHGYGENPPMLNILWLSDTMRHFMDYQNNFSFMGNPLHAEQYFFLMQSRWVDGTPLTYGGNGYQTGAATNFKFPGNPYFPSEWNEKSAGSFPGDRKMVSSVYQEKLVPNGTKNLEFAVIYTRAPHSPNGLNTSWAKNAADIEKIRLWHRNNNFPRCDGPGASVNGEAHKELKGLHIYPNPGSSSFHMDYPGQGEGHANILARDVSGKIIYQSETAPESVYTDSWPVGIYFIQVRHSGKTYNAKWIKLK
jgi:hypothetical protein